LPSMPLRDDSDAEHVARRWSLDRIRLQHVLLHVAFDRARGKHRPGQIPGDLPPEPGGFRQYSGSAHDPAVTPKDQMMI
jgi:hypothetical protein